MARLLCVYCSSSDRLAPDYFALADALGRPLVAHCWGLGFGGWVAAEMAVMRPQRFAHLVLVGPAGLLPRDGYITDQMTIDHEDYVRAGFADEAAFERNPLSVLRFMTSADLERMGRLAFPVIADVLDYEGDSAELGKNLGDDLREGKTTLPLIIAMQRCSPQERSILQRAIEEGNTEQLEPIVNIVRQTGAMQATRAAASMEAQRAIAALSTLPDNPYRQALMALAEQLLDRRT